MRVVRINEAEAIIEPFWDPFISSTVRAGRSASALGDYEVRTAAGAAAAAQGWCALDISVDKAEPGNVAISLTRACDLEVGDYDVFRVFCSASHWACVTVRATVDGREQTLLNAVPGTDGYAELDGRVQGRRMTALVLEVAVAEPRPADVHVLWLGLANRAAQDRMEARPSPYTPEWPGLLAETPGPGRPEVGILFGEADLTDLRRKAVSGHTAKAFEALRAQARKAMATRPEALIGEFVPHPDERWCRTRDYPRPSLHTLMPVLGFIGLVDEDPEMLRMAARMALSLVHCRTWTETPMGNFPGGVWHHRSFTEECCAKACALVLDWAGSHLTENGKEVVREAIIMKGLPRIESDFKRQEYIRHMNQGIVFSGGRIFALLSVMGAYPRYAAQLDEAERDLHEMIDAYVLADGGTQEGMAYWAYTFNTAMPTLYALARRRGKTLRAYAPPSLARTADFPPAMMSTVGDGSTYLPINDAHAGASIPVGLIAALCRLSGKRWWRDLYAAVVAGDSGAGPSDLFHMIVAPPDLPPARPLVRPGFVVLSTIGQVSSVRRAPGLGLVHFHLCSGPTHSGHYHQDKGSFILEAGGEVLAMDRGVTTYGHAETSRMGLAERHNLLVPELPDGSVARQGREMAGGTLISAERRGGAVLLACDNGPAWPVGLFSANVRRVVSPTADLYVIDDAVEMPRSLAMSFRLNSRLPMAARDGEFWIDGVGASLRIVPLNWEPRAGVLGEDGIDGARNPVNVMRLCAGRARTHRLLTALQVVPARAGVDWLWRFERGKVLVAARGNEALRVTPGARSALSVVWDKGGHRAFRASCAGALRAMRVTD